MVHIITTRPGLGTSNIATGNKSREIDASFKLTENAAKLLEKDLTSGSHASVRQQLGALGKQIRELAAEGPLTPAQQGRLGALKQRYEACEKQIKDLGLMKAEKSKDVFERP